MTDIDISEFTFALRIEGDSMEPDFKEGDIIIVDPELEPVRASLLLLKMVIMKLLLKNTVLHLLIFQAASNMNWSPSMTTTPPLIALNAR